jgi:hypothetical protein
VDFENRLRPLARVRQNTWLKLHRPEVYYAAELTEFEQAVIDAGIEVEGVGRGPFPGGVLVTGSKAEAQEKTMELLDANVMALFQPVFEKDGLFAAIDALQFDDAAGEYAIHEIKSSTEIDERHLYDLAFQVILLRKNGRKVSRACLVHPNPNYIRQGELDLVRLFVSVDMTSRVDQIADTVTRELDEARAYLLSDTEPEGPVLLYLQRKVTPLRHVSLFQPGRARVRYPRHRAHRQQPGKAQAFGGCRRFHTG